MQPDREDTGLHVISYDVVTKATLDFNQAMKYMSDRLADECDEEALSSLVDTWWSNLPKVYRLLRLSLEAEGGPEVSLFYLQTRVLDNVWNSCFGLRDGPSPWVEMRNNAKKYRINGKGDCIVTWNTILRDLEDNPARADQVLVSPRGAIEYKNEIAHEDVSAGREEAVDGTPESEAGPQRVKRKHDKVGKTRQKKRKVSPDFEHRNTDVEDDSSDFDAKKSDEEIAVKSEEDQAMNPAGSQITATRTDENTKLPQATPDSNSQRTNTPNIWDKLRKPKSLPSGSNTGPSKTTQEVGNKTAQKVDSSRTKTSKQSGKSMKRQKKHA